jgi:hypothetical protein
MEVLNTTDEIWGIIGHAQESQENRDPFLMKYT